ncbi:MAG: hypothetical protein Q8R60_14885 [Mycobacteriales bacterium]|nr:hypothetical protein [Mycobacteriales bacterium]
MKVEPSEHLTSYQVPPGSPAPSHSQSDWAYGDSSVHVHLGPSLSDAAAPLPGDGGPPADPGAVTEVSM